MKNYSSNRAQKGKTAYRTPSPFKAMRAVQVSGLLNRKGNEKILKPLARALGHTNIQTFKQN